MLGVRLRTKSRSFERRSLSSRVCIFGRSANLCVNEVEGAFFQIAGGDTECSGKLRLTRRCGSESC